MFFGFRKEELQNLGGHFGVFRQFRNEGRSEKCLRERGARRFALIPWDACVACGSDVPSLSCDGGAGKAKACRCLNSPMSSIVSWPLELICSRSNSRTEIAPEINSVSGPSISAPSVVFMA